MTFQNPLLLALFVVLVPAVYFIWTGHLRTVRNLQIFNESSLGTRKRTLVVLVLSLLLLASLLILAAGPQRYITTPHEQVSGNFVFLVDVSRSMAARASCDESMRFDAVKSLMSSIITGMPVARFGIAAFSELTFPFTELSFDRQFLLDVVQNSLVIEAVPSPGSDIGNALLVVAEKKTNNPRVYAPVNYVILLSDGDIPEIESRKLVDVIPVLQHAELRIISVGIGSSTSLPVPTLDNNQSCMPGMYERADGREYYTHLVEHPLRFIAEGTGGRYFSEDESNELIQFLNSTLTHIPELDIPVVKEDISHIFLITGTVSLLGLALIRRA